MSIKNLVVLAILIVILIFHNPISPLTDEQKEIIRQNGLAHATTRKAAREILKKGFISAKKTPLFYENNKVWFYMNEADDVFREKCKYIYNWQIFPFSKKPQKWEVCLIVHLTDKEINNLRIRKYVFTDRAITLKIKGSWKPVKMELRELDNDNIMVR